MRCVGVCALRRGSKHQPRKKPRTHSKCLWGIGIPPSSRTPPRHESCHTTASSRPVEHPIEKHRLEAKASTTFVGLVGLLLLTEVVTGRLNTLTSIIAYWGGVAVATRTQVNLWAPSARSHLPYALSLAPGWLRWRSFSMSHSPNAQLGVIQDSAARCERAGRSISERDIPTPSGGCALSRCEDEL